MSEGIPCLWMRGGTSKGAYFLAADLPADPATRDALLLRIMGSPDPRQIDGIGGADPLTSKVAILSPSSRPDADVDYPFLQVFVDQPLVSATQGCGNILAAVGPAAIERGLVAVAGEVTPVRIHMVNTGEVARAEAQTPGGRVGYAGETAIDGVPGTAAPVRLMFETIAGSMCGALLPTGRALDIIDGVACTLIDNGMPIVVMRATDFGLTGQETRDEIEAMEAVKARIEAIRLQAGPLMGLGDVSEASVPKMTLVSPHRCTAARSTPAASFPDVSMPRSVSSPPLASPQPVCCPTALPLRLPAFRPMGALPSNTRPVRPRCFWTSPPTVTCTAQARSARHAS